MTSKRNGSSRAWRTVREQILRRDARTCNYCGDEATEVDHVIPVAKGGTNDHTNLVAACRRCNRAKSDKHTVFSKDWTPQTPPFCSLSPTLRFDPPTAKG